MAHTAYSLHMFVPGEGLFHYLNISYEEQQYRIAHMPPYGKYQAVLNV